MSPELRCPYKPALEDELGRNGRARVEKLFAEEVIDGRLQLYREALGES